MRVVITGHNGQLGRQLVAAFAEHELLKLDLPCDDITQPDIVDCIADFHPDLVVHGAAYTDVDGCERDPEMAFRVNAVGTQNVALGAQKSGAALLYISTNEVFDGTQRDAYREWDRPSPMSVYARSKAAGEQIVCNLTGGRFYIARIAWLFGPGGVNFVTKILDAATKNGALRVAADEFGNPTYAPDLAQAIAALAATGHYGIYHLTNAGFCSRYEFAAEIVRLAGLTAPVTPILSAEWLRPSRPPLHAILANTAGASLGITMRPWREALAAYVAWLADERPTGQGDKVTG
ncbi:MAG: dTDP-4-dehydrorhamnose reductase [Chloroflexi bacterium]|nr:dTDP-4-dehydrorhamnose reductase [Chloroflexota bacterium]